jgi:hypothetical protein
MILVANTRTIAANLRKLADACPLCGNTSAENRTTYTRCPDSSCSNYSIERAFEIQHGVSFETIPSPGTQEHKNTSNPDVDKLLVSYKYIKISDLELPEPLRADLRSLIDRAVVYVIHVSGPFTHDRIPASYKRTASSFFSEIDIAGCSLFFTAQQPSVFYAAELAHMYMLVDWLTQLFSTVGQHVSAGISKVAYNEISRIVIEQDAGAALRLATRYQNELPERSIQRLEAVVLDHGTPIEAYLFAKDVKGSNTRKLEQKVLASRDFPIIYVFAKNIDGADVKAAEQVVAGSGNTKYIRLFSQNVDGADIELLDSLLRKKLKRSANTEA